MPRPHPLVSTLAIATILAGPAAARDLHGSLSYRERIALPPDAQVVLEVRDATGALVAETRFPTEGRQVPLAFRFAVPDDIALTLHAAVFDAGRPLRKSEAVPVPAGAEDLGLGAVELVAHTAMGFSTPLRCGPEDLTLGFVGDVARLLLDDGRVIDLHPAIAASGARFEAEGDPETWLWSRGQAAMVSIEGRMLADCLPAEIVPARPFRAYGHEPAWSVTLDAETLALMLDFGTTEHDWPAPEARALPHGAAGVVFATDGIEMRARRGICRDIATGMPHPFAVTVAHAGTTLSGCGGAPRDLLTAGAWRIHEIDGTAPPADTRPLRLRLDDDRMALDAPCNQAMGPYTLTGEGLGFGPVGATLMMCAPETMETEAALFAALGSVDRFDISDAGDLHLMSADRVVLRAAPLPQE